MQIWNIKRAGENVFTISNFYGFYLYMLYVTTFYLDSTGISKKYKFQNSEWNEIFEKEYLYAYV